MNIDRGLAQLGVSKAGDANATSPSKAHEGKPAFELPDHEAIPARDTSAHGRTMPPRAAQARASREPSQPRDPASTANDEPTVQAREPAKPHETPNAAARRDGSDDARSAGAPDDGSPATDAATMSPAADGATSRAPAGADDAALPDRMLALLSAAPFAAAPAATSTLVGAKRVLGLALASPTNEPAAPSSAPLTAALAATAVPAAAQPAAAPATADAATLTAFAPTLAPASKDAADPFAALAALADRPREGTTTSSDGTATGTGFAPLLIRGADGLQSAVRTAAAAPAALPLMLDADFDDGLGARVTWMAEQRIDHAQIRVSPDALGPIDVRLQMDGHRVHAQFHAANADVRQALEAGMDRLRDLLGRQGMELGQAQVGSGARQGADGRSGGGPKGFGGDATDASATDSREMRVALRPSRGLLDEYA